MLDSRNDDAQASQPGDTHENAIDAVVMIDGSNNISAFNGAAERLWGYRRAEVIGKNVKMLLPPDMRTNHDSFVDRHRKTGQDRIVGTSREVPIHCKDNTTAYARLSLRQTVTAEGAKQYTAFLTDVTEQHRKTTAAVEVMRDLLDQIDRLTTGINTIAQQTNLLSVNASIEAARAGDMGRGFGVVAMEIRALSNQAKEITLEIENVVESGRQSVGNLAKDAIPTGQID
ncbi:hypothetical protein A8B82_02560 [Sulfitobacter sp. EhC04]|uniref:methyl-accepting chemotaxis protein n=1 Tax=Sulfitobacter sp. EhC04 TaxID=1849168 RepID=UPI0007F52EC3|nr:methyl-accepting chemotaxis protein [Sulfitobacter sp. EhC04]OAN73404.1 hypothetical protein A8B82_02560 [Sulfitobacter sp. EhC04]